MTTNRPLKVFLCHSSNDKPAVRELYNALKSQDWVDPWLDKMKILPGQNWRIVIEEAVEASDIIIICISNHSVTKEGFVQREIRYAYDLALEKPDSVIFLIPLRLENCEVPRGMRSFQWVDYFGFEKEEQYSNLLESLKLRHKQKLQLEEKERNLSNTQEEKHPEKKQNDMDWMDDYHSKHAKPLEKYKTDKIILSNGMEFMRVPAGTFLMGSTKENMSAYNDERPQHTVDIPYDCWMARFPVTNEFYYAYTKSQGIEHPVRNWEQGKNHPVVNVSWNEAMDYCRWLNTLFKIELPSKLILRLPTESEWEKAARGVDGREYPWGNTFDKNKCNTKEGEKGNATPAGLYSPQGDSPYGCADMSGNIWEHTHSLKKAYPYKFDDGRENENIPGVRIMRGGSFSYDMNSARCTRRLELHLIYRSKYFGLRIVLAPPLPK